MRFDADRRTLGSVGAPVFLCGMMGAGKSSVGRVLAARRSSVFVDLDARIERMFGVSIAEAFGHGEDAFRRLEREALTSLLAEPGFEGHGAVVATGGGVVVDPENRRRMDRAGVRVLLAVPPEALAARLSGHEGAQRPLVADADDVDDVEQRLRALWLSRRNAYEDGAVVVDGVGTIPEVTARVLAALEDHHRTI